MFPPTHTAGLLVLASVLAACAPMPAAPAAAESLDAAIRSRPIVLLGEVHDNAVQHALRAQALRRWVEGGARPVIVMEQFDRERQADIDRELAGAHPSVDGLIAAGAPNAAAMQGWDWALYRPYLALVVQYRLTLLAGNVSREDTRRVVKEGLGALGFDGGVPEDIVRAQAEAIVDGHCGMLDETQARGIVPAQVARDQFMARVVEDHAAQGVVLLAGNGHVRRDVGVPRWLGTQVRYQSVSIGLLERGDANGMAFDIVVRTAGQGRADPCVALRRTPMTPSAPAAGGS
jgi:uncharacterized iron-regulated protein